MVSLICLGDFPSGKSGLQRRPRGHGYGRNAALGPTSDTRFPFSPGGADPLRQRSLSPPRRASAFVFVRSTCHSSAPNLLMKQEKVATREMPTCEF